MKKKLVTTILTLLLVSGLCSIAETIEAGYVSVNASAPVEIVPNQVEISIGVQTVDKSLKKATEMNKKISNEVYTALKAKISSSSDYIKTEEFSVRPQYIYNSENKSILDKYMVSNVVVVKTKNLQSVSSLIDLAVSKGATNIDNLRFSAVDYDNICAKTLSELTQKTYAKAGIVAKSINAKIIGVKSISTNCSAENNSRPFYNLMAKGALASGSETPIDSGKIKLYAVVDASYYVK